MKKKKISQIISMLATVGYIFTVLPQYSYSVFAESSSEQIENNPDGTVPEQPNIENTDEIIENDEPALTTAPFENETTVTETVSLTTEPVFTEISDEEMIQADTMLAIGDLNGDGEVDIADATLILSLYAALAANIEHDFTPEQTANADCNSNGTADIDDASLVLSYYAYKAAGIIDISFEDYLADPPVITTPETTTTTTTTTSSSTTTTTTTTTTTSTTTTTTPTVTTAMPSSTALNVNCILQKASPSLPTGCEATALTIALNYYGFGANKYDIAMTYLPRMNFTGSYGADFRYVFPGDPSSESGYGCYAPAITATANAYFTANKNASYAENISGTDFTDLYKYIAQGTPVVFWGTMNMSAPFLTSSWYTPDGKYVTWNAREHCLVLVGYNKSAGTVLVADPLKGTVTYDANLVEQRYNDMGKNAVIIHKSNEYKGENGSVTSGGIYRIKNAGSGLYLTVSGGNDTSGANVIQQSANGSLSQQFRIKYDEASNSYRLYSMCSSDGNDKVIDIAKIGGWVVGGSNVQIYSPVDAPAQTFVIEPYLNGTIRFSCRTNRNACLAVNGSVSGSSTGSNYNSSGNAVIKTFTGDSSQLWYLEAVQ